ncbi:response regulator (plasmid) [Deinococcus radiodurans]|nr:response regulator [Deinococcus radiodurans]
MDDSEADRYVLTTLLTRAGYEVDEVAYAEPGLEQARSGAYDAVVLDLNLPDRSGLDVLRALRENAGTRSLPVLVVIAAALDAAERAALETLGPACTSKKRSIRMSRCCSPHCRQGACTMGKPLMPEAPVEPAASVSEPTRSSVLVVDDNAAGRYVTVHVLRSGAIRSLRPPPAQRRWRRLRAYSLT